MKGAVVMFIAAGVSTAVLWAVCATRSNGDFVLAFDGESRCEIVSTGNALVDADIVFFTNAVRRVSGAMLPIVATRSPDSRAVVFDVRKADLFHEDAYEVSFPNAQTMRVSGSRHSCRWALNHVLERFGVVFCLPGEHGTHWPRLRHLSLPATPFAGDASLKIERHLYKEDPAWERCLGGKEQRVGQFYNHNLCNIFPVKKYGESPWREKLMPMRGGVRARPTNDFHGWQPCFSAPEAVTEAVNNIRAYLAAHPDERVFSLTVNDNGGYCECDGCRRSNGGTFDEPRAYGPPKTTSRSKTYFSWANAVAAEMEKTHPDVVFGILAYGATIDPPPFRLRHNMLPFICASVYQSHNEKMWNIRHELMKAWSEKCDAFGLWDYAYGMRLYALPRVYLHTVDRYFSLKDGDCPSFNAYFGEGSSLNGEGPKRWFYYKKLFNTALDCDATVDVWYRAVCGEEAAPFLRDYYALWEDFWTGEAVRTTTWYPSIERGYCDFNSFAYLNAIANERIVRADALMKQAVEAAARSGDDDQKIRARWLENCHAYYNARVALLCAFLGDKPYDGASEPTATPAETATLIGRVPAYSRALADVKAAAERVSADRDPKSWPFGAHVCGSFVAGAALDTSFESRLVSFMKHSSAPEVRAAAIKARDDPRTTSRFRAILGGVLEGAHGPDRFSALTKTKGEDSAAWMKHKSGIRIAAEKPQGHGNRYRVTGLGGWAAMMRFPKGLSAGGKAMLYSARIENISKASTIGVRIHYEAWGDRGTSRRVDVRPGEAAVAEVPLVLRDNEPKFYLIFNNMNKGDEVLVDGISLRDLE